jgi:hypothetical protein
MRLFVAGRSWFQPRSHAAAVARIRSARYDAGRKARPIPCPGRETIDNEPNDDEDCDVIDVWPACPQCQKPRMTICPYCQTAGTELPRADANFSADLVELESSTAPEARLAVICPVCDEPWSARFMRVCEWCSHDFGVGLVEKSRPTRDADELPFNPRATLVATGLALTMGALMFYFLVIARR